MEVTKTTGGAKAVNTNDAALSDVTSHPAVDNEPRKGASRDSNQIDFNDPTLTLTEQVVQNLVEQNLKAPEQDAE